MPYRVCLGYQHLACRVLVPDASRCPEHQRMADAAALRVKRARRPVNYRERKRRAAAVTAWIAEHGAWCPGWGVPGHESTDLTAAHVVAVAAGGAESGPLDVLCRACNARQGVFAGQRADTPPYQVR